MRKKKECIDCGNAQVNHTVTYINRCLEWAINPYISWMDGIWHRFEHKIDPFLDTVVGPGLLRGLHAIGLAPVRTSPAPTLTGRATVMWEEAIKRNVELTEYRLFGIGQELFIANWNGHRFAFDGLPRPLWMKIRKPWLMDDKSIMREEFIKHGIIVAKGGKARTYKQALEIFKTLEKPVIIKPHIGSRSRHTTTHIFDESELRDAINRAHKLSPWVIIEEELSGMVHRVTLINGRVVAVLRRDPPMVEADGIHTVQELIDEENKNPLRHGPIFHELHIDDAAITELKLQGYTPESIPPKGAFVKLNQKTSRGIGGGATDVTDTLHPDNQIMFERAGSVIDDPLVGMDVIINDMSVSWKEQPRSGIIECNSLPFIDLHHFPLKGKVQNVAGKLWDACLTSLS